MIIGYSRTFGASLPATGMTFHFDFSDISTLYKTYTPTADPAYSDVATADADVIRIARSIFPAATSDLTLHDANDSSKAPVLRSSSPLLGTQCLDFDGTNDRLVLANRTGAGGQRFDDVFTASAMTFLVAFRCESLPPADTNFQPLFADNSVNFRWGLYIYNQSGTVKILAQNHDGSYDDAFGATVAVDTNYVAMYRHESGNIYVSLNGGSETSVASGDCTAINEGMFLGGGGNASVLNGRIGEIAGWNVALTGTDLSDALTYFTDKWT